MIVNFPVPFHTDGRRAYKTDGFGSPRGDHTHQGIDIFYPRVANEPKPPAPWYQGDKWQMFPFTPAIAVGPGIVSRAGIGNKGEWVEIDHQDGMMTIYRHLAPKFLNTGAKVTAGQPVGYIGDDPSNPHDGAHLHFELKINGSTVDPYPYVADAPVINAGGSLLNNDTLMKVAFVVGAGYLVYSILG